MVFEFELLIYGKRRGGGDYAWKCDCMPFYDFLERSERDIGYVKREYNIRKIGVPLKKFIFLYIDRSREVHHRVIILLS